MMHIEIVYADIDDQQHIDLQVEEGADVAKCLDLLRLHSQGEGWLFEGLTMGVFGEVCGLERVLKEGDRLEFYRPLIADAKTARRLRAKSQSV